MQNKKILITGGAGFIGSLVNKMLDNAGYQTVVIDNLSSGHRDAVVRGEFVEGDIGSRADLENIFENHQIDAVMHFAASIDVGESVHNPEKYFRNNVTNSLTLLNTMLDYSIHTLVFSSTAAVYGTPIEVPISEDHSLNPINPYGESKLMLEKILHDFDEAYGLKYCSLRYFNAAGGDPDGEIPNRKSSEHNLIPRALRSLLPGGEKLSVYGSDYHTPDGTCIRDYIHLFDLGTAHILAMKKLLAGGESRIYNLGNGNGFTVKQVIEAAGKVVGHEIPYEIVGRREGDPEVLVADARKAKEELGWEPKYPDLESMVRDARHALTSWSHT